MHEISPPTFDDLCNAQLCMSSTGTPSEIHGYFCAILSATTKPKAISLKKKFFKGPFSDDLKLFDKLFESTEKRIKDSHFDFHLLLPDDEEDINLRTENLGLWCQGYLLGLNHAGIDINKREKNEQSELLQDLIAISEISYGDIKPNNKNETAYAELVEYIKLAALNLYQFLASKRKTTKGKS